MGALMSRRPDFSSTSSTVSGRYSDLIGDRERPLFLLPTGLVQGRRPSVVGTLLPVDVALQEAAIETTPPLDSSRPTAALEWIPR